jgi:hypothetical protein
MRISNGGAVSIGLTTNVPYTSAAQLNVSRIGLYASGSNVELGWYGTATPAIKFLAWWDSAIDRLQITDSDFSHGVQLAQNSNAWAGYSDARLKQDITLIPEAVATVKGLKPCIYVWKSSQTNDVGFVAQETKTVFPLAVEGEESDFSVDEETGRVSGAMGVKMDKIVPLLTAALQEALQKIEDLEGRLTAAGI